MTVTSLEKHVSAFRDYVKKIVSYQQALSVLNWDMRTNAPAKGMDSRSDVIGALSAEHFRLTTSKEMEEFLTTLQEPSALAMLDDITRATVLDCKKTFDLSKKIPVERYQEFVVLTSQAETIWEEAREKNDFAMFQPYLEKIVSMQLEFIKFWGKGTSTPKYDILLDMYETGMTTEQLDNIFATIRQRTVPLVAAIAQSPNKPDITPYIKHFPAATQEVFSRFVLEKIGYDFKAGRMDTSTHPFCTSFGPKDVRITTAYVENDFKAALWSCMHEAGHAMYEQNISYDLEGTTLCDGTSMGIHESQSRYWENMIGRSKTFWKHFYPNVLQEFPEQFADVSVEEFYRGINSVEPSLIRIDADEVTYNLHIMIRYEIEKGLINQTIKVADLPRIWNEKMKEYLGIDVPNDAMGVLQDPHWAGGSFGYFPTYSLGNVYAAQFVNTMKKDLPSYDELIASGNFTPIREWLIKNIYQHGKMKTPKQLLQDVTGEPTNAIYLVNYLEEKCKEIYQL